MSRQDIEERITELVIKQLEEGKVPWRKPWTSAGYAPTSLTSGKPYRGINTLLLAILGEDYERSLWLTYKQAQALGGNVRKGESGLPIVFWSQYVKEVNGEEQKACFLKNFTVFNVAQCDGVDIPAKYLTTREPVETLPALTELVNGYLDAPTIYHKEQGRAFYSPSADSITLPSKEQFDEPEEYAYTLLHELSHSTAVADLDVAPKQDVLALGAGQR